MRNSPNKKFQWPFQLGLFISAKIRRGEVGVLPTDTIYGLVGSALSKKSVARIYKLRKRNSKKPFIILIASVKDLAIFGIKLDKRMKNFLNRIWPLAISGIGKVPACAKASAGRPAVSVILDCDSKKFSYLHRGTNSLAFRIPANQDLRNFLKKTGPLAAPSANLEGLPPAHAIKEAENYFGARADFYVDAGRMFQPPSILIKIIR